MTTPASPPANGAPAGDGQDSAAIFRLVQRALKESFALEQVVAHTGERVLFLARDLILKRRVALRVQLKHGTRERAWFERETELLASLDHPSVRPVFSAGHVGEWAYRVSKWIDGESLLDATARGPRPVPTVVQLARDLTSLLDFAHTERIILRRILPATVMLDRSGRSILTDLRYANRCLDVASPDLDPDAVAYLAPEARDGKPGEPASDIYTAGALLYVAATGISPTADPKAIQAPTALRASVPKAVERVILRSLSAEPGKRYLTAREMADDLISDLGDFDLPTGIAPSISSGSEDARAWEKRLRRALGDDYELLNELGSGGFGRVYRVRDLRLEREVALKVLHPFLTADPAVVERFHKEAQLAARLLHPNIVSIYDIGGRAGLLWYTMAYVPGMSLGTLVQTHGPLPVDRATRILEQSLAALIHAHSLGLVHRDIKPENMLIHAGDGSVRIADFGLALALQGTGGKFGGATSRSGTPEFAAPEQLLGEHVDARADLFALAAVGYFMLCGKPPFGRGSVETIVARQTLGGLPDVEEDREDVPPGLIAVLSRATQRQPVDRFDSAEQFLQELRRVTRGKRGTPVPWLRRILG
ncbi:MAG TPA: serine/threonine-protein kinase [Gemmatimonadales bacterium]